MTANKLGEGRGIATGSPWNTSHVATVTVIHLTFATEAYPRVSVPISLKFGVYRKSGVSTVMEGIY